MSWATVEFRGICRFVRAHFIPVGMCLIVAAFSAAVFGASTLTDRADAQTAGGTITLTKESVGPTETVQIRSTVGLFSLETGESITIDVPSGTTVLNEKAAGSYIAEIVCTQGTATLGPRTPFFNHEFTIDLVDGAADCTIRNAPVVPATFNITKITSNGDRRTPFNIRISAGLEAGTPAVFETVVGGGTFSFTTSDSSAALSETTPPGWSVDSFTCDRDLTSQVSDTADSVLISDIPGEGGIVNCELVNLFAPTTLVIEKQVALGDVTTEFDFEVSAGSPAEFTLTDGTSSSVEFVGSDRIRVTEQLPFGWLLPDVDCDAGEVAEDTQGGFPRYTLTQFPEGRTITCVFTNRLAPPTRVIVEKRTVGPSPDIDFDFYGPLGAFTMKDGDSTELLVPPTEQQFVIDELRPPGWATEVDCEDVEGVQTFSASRSRATGVRISLAASGKELTCVFTNTWVGAGTLTLDKQVIGGDTSATFLFQGPEGEFTLGAGDSVSIDLPLDGEMTVVEPADPDWNASVRCAPIDSAATGWLIRQDFLARPDTVLELTRPFPGLDGNDFRCTFVNSWARTVGITVNKQLTNEDSSTAFPFSSEYESVFLKAGESHRFEVKPTDEPTELTPLVLITEDLDGLDWVPLAGACDLPSIRWQPNGEIVAIAPLVAGDEFECTVINAPRFAEVHITKQTDEADLGTEFTFEGPDGTFVVESGETVTITVPVDSPILLNEVVPQGWEPVSAECDSPSEPSDDSAGAIGSITLLPLGPAAEANCTFVNRRVSTAPTPTPTPTATPAVTTAPTATPEVTTAPTSTPITVTPDPTPSAATPTPTVIEPEPTPTPAATATEPEPRPTPVATSTAMPEVAPTVSLTPVPTRASSGPFVGGRVSGTGDFGSPAQSSAQRQNAIDTPQQAASPGLAQTGTSGTAVAASVALALIAFGLISRGSGLLRQDSHSQT